MFTMRFDEYYKLATSLECPAVDKLKKLGISPPYIKTMHPKGIITPTFVWIETYRAPYVLPYRDKIEHFILNDETAKRRYIIFLGVLHAEIDLLNRKMHPLIVDIGEEFVIRRARHACNYIDGVIRVGYSALVDGFFEGLKKIFKERGELNI
ncbi:MAG: hypothetical protein JZD41_02350 [Thermoproteus sp.]|nr:hypothetical protein [Thermoproteus sp.]